jgi:hypothetical protein
MEEQIFPSPAVAGLLTENFVEARIHTDHNEKGEAQRKMQQDMVGLVAAPYYVIVDPKTRQQLREHKLENVGDGWDQIRDKFADFLRPRPE